MKPSRQSGVPWAILIAGALLAVAAAGCGEEDINDVAKGAGSVTISGNIAYATYPGSGQFGIGVFPIAVPPGPTGDLGGAWVAGGTVAPYTVPVPAGSGDVLVFAFHDDDSSGSPGGPEFLGCATTTVDAVNVTGVNVTLASPPSNCP